jgi:hypothetical protein
MDYKSNINLQEYVFNLMCFTFPFDFFKNAFSSNKHSVS